MLEVRDGAPFVGIAIDLATRWEVVSDLEELQRAGIDLVGLFVVRRDPDPGQRRLAGRIAAVRAGKVELAESTTDQTAVDAKSIMLEGRLDVFARCLRTLLAEDYRRLDEYRYLQVGRLLDGPALTNDVAQILGRQPLELARGLTCAVSPPMLITNSAEYESVVPARPNTASTRPGASATSTRGAGWPVTARSAGTLSPGRARASWSYFLRPRRAQSRSSSGTCATGYPITRVIRLGSRRPSGSSTRAST